LQSVVYEEIERVVNEIKEIKGTIGMHASEHHISS